MASYSTVSPWVLVCGGFHRLGGMDRANLALAEALLEEGREVYLVGHNFAPELPANPRVHATVVPRPLGILVGERALRHEGMRVAAEVTRRRPGARVLVNGGNCAWPDINWVHSVHAAWPRFDSEAPLWFRTKSRINKQKGRRDELYALRRSKLVIANSRRTRNDLIALGVPDAKIRTVCLGSEPGWSPPTAEAKAKARASFDLPQDAAIVSFAGALGYDRNKGFDTLLAAWREANLPHAILVAAGGGRGFSYWQQQIEKIGLQHRVRLLGFTDRAGELLAASDLFVSPVRYEAFGLNVLEAICRAVPSIVSRSAGVAELYPQELSRYLLNDPADVHALSGLLTHWSRQVEDSLAEFANLSVKLRSFTMRDMARQIIAIAECR